MADLEFSASVDTSRASAALKALQSTHGGMTNSMLADVRKLIVAEVGLARQQEKTRTATAATASRTRGGDVRGGMSGGRNSAFVAGQLAMQAQDVAVQLQMGAKATTVIAQQGSQILSIFGPGGQILGGLLAISAAAWSWARGTAAAEKAAKEAEKSEAAKQKKSEISKEGEGEIRDLKSKTQLVKKLSQAEGVEADIIKLRASTEAKIAQVREKYPNEGRGSTSLAIQRAMTAEIRAAAEIEERQLIENDENKRKVALEDERKDAEKVERKDAEEVEGGKLGRSLASLKLNAANNQTPPEEARLAALQVEESALKNKLATQTESLDIVRAETQLLEKQAEIVETKNAIKERDRGSANEYAGRVSSREANRDKEIYALASSASSVVPNKFQTKNEKPLGEIGGLWVKRAFAEKELGAAERTNEIAKRDRGLASKEGMTTAQKRAARAAEKKENKNLRRGILRDMDREDIDAVKKGGVGSRMSQAERRKELEKRMDAAKNNTEETVRLADQTVKEIADEIAKANERLLAK